MLNCHVSADHANSASTSIVCWFPVNFQKPLRKLFCIIPNSKLLTFPPSIITFYFVISSNRGPILLHLSSNKLSTFLNVNKTAHNHLGHNLQHFKKSKVAVTFEFWVGEVMEKQHPWTTTQWKIWVVSLLLASVIAMAVTFSNTKPSW